MEDQAEIYKLPVCYGRENNVITSAYVDKELLPYLARFHWYLSDPKRPKSPKTQMRIGGVPKSMMLNRVVYTLNLLSEEERDLITDRVNIGKLYELVTEQPKLRFKVEDPFDCRINNIAVALQDVDESVLKMHNEDQPLTGKEIDEARFNEMRRRFADHNADTRSKLYQEELSKKEVPEDIEIARPLFEIPDTKAEEQALRDAGII